MWGLLLVALVVRVLLDDYTLDSDKRSLSSFLKGATLQSKPSLPTDEIIALKTATSVSDLSIIDNKISLNESKATMFIVHAINGTCHHKDDGPDGRGGAYLDYINYTSQALVPDIRNVMIFDEMPILLPSSSESKPYATCKIYQEYYEYSRHFPHLMQQFYRCWVYWQSFPNYQPVLLTDHHWIFHSGFPFTNDLITLLPKMGVKIVDMNDLSATNQSATAKSQLDDGSDASSLSVSAYSVWPDSVSYQTTTPEKIRSLYYSILQALDLDDQHPNDSCIPRISLLNRDKTRRLLNSQEIRTHLQMNLGVDIPEYDFEGQSLQYQLETMARTDILVTPHGAQETSIVFMPPDANILEILPQDFYTPHFFGTLAATAGIYHKFLYMAQNTSDHELDYRLRSVDLCVMPRLIKEGLEELIQKWKQGRGCV